MSLNPFLRGGLISGPGLRLDYDIDIGGKTVGALGVGDAEFESKGSFSSHQWGEESCLGRIGIEQGDFAAQDLGPVVLE